MLSLGAGLPSRLFWQQEPVNRVVSAILQGHTFKMQWLLSTAQKLRRLGIPHFVIQPRCIMRLFCVLVILDEAIAASNQAIVDSAYGPYMTRPEGHSPACRRTPLLG